MTERCPKCLGTGYADSTEPMVKIVTPQALHIGTMPCPYCNGKGVWGLSKDEENLLVEAITRITKQ